MRRTDKEITDRSLMDWVIRQAIVCRLGLSQGDRVRWAVLLLPYRARGA